MGKTSYLLIGALVGAAAGAVVNYLFGPAQATTFDQGYRSRLDFALEEGERAADAREAELRRHFDDARRARPQLPPADLSSSTPLLPDSDSPSAR